MRFPPAPRSRSPRPYSPHRRLIPLPESPPRNIIMPARPPLFVPTRHGNALRRAAGVNGPVNESGIKAAVARVFLGRTSEPAI